MDDYKIEGRPQSYVRDGLVHIEKISTMSFTRVNETLKKLQKNNFKIINVSIATEDRRMFTFAIVYKYTPE